MKPLKVLSKFENHFAIKTVHFQVSLDAGGYFFFFYSGSVRVCNRNALLCESDRYHFGNHHIPITPKEDAYDNGTMGTRKSGHSDGIFH